jgi:hypothetical protein
MEGSRLVNIKEPRAVIEARVVELIIIIIIKAIITIIIIR